MSVSKTPLLLAILAGIVVYLVPYGELAVYPFTLFVTLIHEGGHVLMALLTGSHVHSMAIAPNGSGLTLTSPRNPIAGILISNAGYLSATAYGAIVLHWANAGRNPRGILRFSACLIAGLVVFFTIFVKDWQGAIWADGLHISFGMKLFTILAGFLIAYGLWLVSKAQNPNTLAFVANFLAVQCIFNSLGDIKTVLALSVYTEAHSDARNLAEMTGIPSVVWAAGWGLISLWVVVSAFRAVWAKTR